MSTETDLGSATAQHRGNGSLSEELFETMVRASADGMLAIDPVGKILFANQAAGELLGRDSASLLGAEFGLPFATGDAVEVELFHPTRGTRVAELRVAVGPDGILVAMLRDVSQRVRLRNELQRLALADQLTGVGNRRAFLALGDQALKLAEREKRACALLFVDIDKMKLINDRFGHRAGDRAVIETARMLTRTVRDSDIVARVGGDEFCVLLTGTSRQDSVQEAIQRVEESASTLHEAVNFPLSVTVGATFFDPSDPKPIGALMEAADSEMYVVKRNRAVTHSILALGGPALGRALRDAFGDEATLNLLEDHDDLDEAAVTPGVSMLVLDARFGDTIAILQRITQWPGAANLPIAVWQPDADSALEQQAFAAGASEVVDGQAPPSVLRARLDRLID